MKTAYTCILILLILYGKAFSTVNVSSAQNDNGLLLEYKFEEGAIDTSNKQCNGRLQGNPTFAKGRIGKCLVLDGKDDFIDCGPSPVELGQTFTVECWVKPDIQQNPFSNIFGNHDDGGLGFVTQQDGTNTNRFTMSYGAGSGRWIMTRPVRLTPGKWQHVALVKTTETLTFFLNGTAVDSVPATAPLVVSPTTLRVGLGFRGPERCFRGCIDEFRVWNKAITNFELSLSQEEKIMPMVESLRIEWRSVDGKNGDPHWEFTIPVKPNEKIQNGKSEIEVTIEAIQWPNNRRIGIPSVKLSEFKGVVDPSFPPGVYTITARPQIVTNEGKIAGEACEFAWVSNRPAVKMKAVKPGMKIQESVAPALSQTIPLDGPNWRIAVDPKNEGREKKWFNTPPSEVRQTKVPWVIQDIFPEYHGVAWYWREFDGPVNPNHNGRILIRFKAVDYMAEVWVNGERIGSHEGGESPFMLDATNAIHPEGKNLLAVRVINPTFEPIDGIVLKQTASGVKNNRITGNMSYNAGGIVDSVILAIVPKIYIDDIFVLSDWQNGQVRVHIGVFNTNVIPTESMVRITIADVRTGEVAATGTYSQKINTGSSLSEATLNVQNHRLWELSNPTLYRVTVQLAETCAKWVDEQSVRFGFRDFRFTNGYFRLNGKRILLKGGGYISHFPAGYTVPLDEDMLRRDVVNMKALGFNFCRLAFGGIPARMLDIFDELGVMVHQEHFGSWQFEDSPQMFTRWNRSIGEIIMRDRNHPSVVEWGMLNETMGGTLHDYAAASIPFVRSLDPSRMLILNSGGSPVGTLSNPGANSWDVGMKDLMDVHFYVSAPIPPIQMDVLRTGEYPERIWGIYESFKPEVIKNAALYISEYGQSGSQDLPAIVANYERLGHSKSDEALYYRSQCDLFIADWNGWQLSDTWPRTEDYADDANHAFAELRKIGETAIRANPRVAAYTPTHLVSDITYSASGATDFFREFKPYVPEAYLLANTPL